MHYDKDEFGISMSLSFLFFLSFFLSFLFFFFIKMGFHHDGQAGVELLTSGDPPALASQSAGITGVSHCTWSYSQSFYSSL